MTKHIEYMAHETRWLLSFGTHPLNIAKQLNHAPASIYMLARRHELADIKAAFSPYQKVARS